MNVKAIKRGIMKKNVTWYVITSRRCRAFCRTTPCSMRRSKRAYQHRGVSAYLNGGGLDGGCDLASAWWFSSIAALASAARGISRNTQRINAACHQASWFSAATCAHISLRASRVFSTHICGFCIVFALARGATLAQTLTAHEQTWRAQTGGGTASTAGEPIIVRIAASFIDRPPNGNGGEGVAA